MRDGVAVFVEVLVLKEFDWSPLCLMLMAYQEVDEAEYLLAWIVLAVAPGNAEEGL